MKRWMRIGIICAVAAAAAGVTAIFSGSEFLTTVLAVLMAADYISGILASAIKENLDSRIGLRGALYKGLIYLVICAAAFMDRLAGFSASPLRCVACLYFIGSEAISIVKNLSAAGLPMPKRCKRLFEQYNQAKIARK